MCFGTTNCAVQRRADELRVRALQGDGDAVLALGPDRGDVVAGAGDTDPVHRLVLPAGQKAVDHVGRCQRRPVRPLRVPREGEGERLVAVRPLPTAGEPRLCLDAAGRDGDQRLVESTLRDGVGRQPATGIGVEVLREGWVTRPGHHEAFVAGLCAVRHSGGTGDARARKQCDDREDTRQGGGRPEPADGTRFASHTFPFSQRRDRPDACGPARISGNVYTVATESQASGV